VTALDEVKIGGLGASRRRVEDARFVRGRGNYVDDIHLPGMLHMEILRSPLAHARIKSIDTSKAWEIPGVRLVLTGEMMAQRNLAWMPTLSYDTQAVLATDKVRFQGQEVACVIADDPYIAKDACEAIDVEYEPLPVIVNPRQAVAEGAPVIRDDKDSQRDNVIYDWEVGDKAGTDRAFEQADLVSKLQLHYPRSHPSPIECCGSIADFNRATSKLTVYMTSQAPHIIRAAVALVAELPEHMIRIISPDIGGGFGNKVPVYPGYVCSILASILLERPVKWIEDKSGNLISTGFARDVYLDGEMALRRDGKILGVRIHTDADHGAFFSDAQPSKFKIGLMHSAFAAYDIPAAHLTARGTYSNKAPGGVAYRCSFRVTEAMFFQERMMQAAATDLGLEGVQAVERARRVHEFVNHPQAETSVRTEFNVVTCRQLVRCLNQLEEVEYAVWICVQARGLIRNTDARVRLQCVTENRVFLGKCVQNVRRILLISVEPCQLFRAQARASRLAARFRLPGGEERMADQGSPSDGAAECADDPARAACCAKQQRNVLATLLLSQGVPMLCAGDEMGRTQQGHANRDDMTCSAHGRSPPGRCRMRSNVRRRVGDSAVGWSLLEASPPSSGGLTPSTQFGESDGPSQRRVHTDR
jgi:carbon-monoxide dehydrogenase large subunit